MTNANEPSEANIQREANRVRAMLSAAVEEVESDGGDMRAFAACFLTAAVQLHAEVEGTGGLKRAMADLAGKQIMGEPPAGRA